METTGTITVAISILGIAIAAALAMGAIWRWMRKQRHAELADEARRERELETREEWFETLTGHKPGGHKCRRHDR